ncbi:hypothetical protein IPF89_01005 [Candidatus Saccharibacteria bacterium]|nr:MAG: hypothetical protein IPF89_01005 [Candidatus Saccharibacteria bacterium]
MRFIDRYNPLFHISHSPDPTRAAAFVAEIKAVVAAADSMVANNPQSVEAALRQAAADKAGTGEQWLVRLVGSSAELFAAEMEVMRPDARSLAA